MSKTWFHNPKRLLEIMQLMKCTPTLAIISLRVAVILEVNASILTLTCNDPRRITAHTVAVKFNPSVTCTELLRPTVMSGNNNNRSVKLIKRYISDILSVVPSLMVTTAKLVDCCMLTGVDALIEREIVSSFSTASSSIITKV